MYSLQSKWDTGFSVGLTVTNTGGAALTGWTVTLDYTNIPGNQVLSNGWGGFWSQTFKVVTVSNALYNGNLAIGQAIGPPTGLVGAVFTNSGSTDFGNPAVTCTPMATPMIIASPVSLSVGQGHTGTFTLALSEAPASNETVSIATAGNPGLIAFPTVLTFTPANFATAQTVTVTAGAGTGITTFTASGTGYTSASVFATE
jgi:hypothetical protein